MTQRSRLNMAWRLPLLLVVLPAAMILAALAEAIDVCIDWFGAARYVFTGK